MNTAEQLSERVEGLQVLVAELRDQLAGFIPLTVDLRIDGVVRPVVLFARQSFPSAPQFKIVE